MNNKLYILCGIPFSGKTTLAKKLERKLGFKVIDLDEVKFDLFGKEIKDNDIKEDGLDKVYQEVYKRIETNLIRGKTVIHDTGNFTKSERDLVKMMADKLSIKTVTIFVDTPKEVARERLLQNRKTTQRFDVTDEDFEGTTNEMELPSESEEHIVYKFGTPMEVWIKQNFM